MQELNPSSPADPVFVQYTVPGMCLTPPVRFLVVAPVVAIVAAAATIVGVTDGTGGETDGTANQRAPCSPVTSVNEAANDGTTDRARDRPSRSPTTGLSVTGQDG